MNKENLDGWAISIELYEWLHENLPKGSTILELGSGTGTIELSESYNMVSIEHNVQWLNKAPTTYIHAPITVYDGYSWYDKDIIKESLPEAYDLILVDGPPKNINGNPIGRVGFLHNLALFDSSVPIIIDDTNRQAERALADGINKKLGREMKVIGGHEKSFIILL